MRFYDIQITPTKGEARRYSATVGGRPDPRALQVEFDIPVSTFAVVAAQGGGLSLGAAIRIWGVSLREIGQAADLNGAAIKVYGGMQTGLPLANSQQAGLLISGTVNQAFGNWIGVEMTLDLVVMNDGTPPNEQSATPKNLPFVWKKGTALADAISTTISTGFPGYTAEINISPNLVLAADEAGQYESIVQFAQYLKTLSLGIIAGDPNYRGVDIVLTDKVFKVYDGATPEAPKQLAFIDLVGQPTWIDFNKIQFTCVMRADLVVGSVVRMPAKAIATTTAQSAPRYRDKSVFQGPFRITSIHQIGNFRSPDATAWVTIYNAVPALDASTVGTP